MLYLFTCCTSRGSLDIGSVIESGMKQIVVWESNAGFLSFFHTRLFRFGPFAFAIAQLRRYQRRLACQV